MVFPRAKSVDALYEECRDYDVVLVPDPPLGSALNRRVTEPHFGHFAITPRRLAAGGRATGEDRLAFLSVIEETEIDWKTAADAVGNVLHCWDNTGSAEAILSYERFDTSVTREVLSCIRELDLTTCRLDEYTVDETDDVAVVGIDEFTPLERSILPSEYHEIDSQADDTFDHPPFRLFDSPAAIVDTIIDSVTAANADRVAIVLDRGSQYSSLVESALEGADIPFYGGPGFTDHPDHRAFLRLLRVAHAGTDVRVGEVRPLLARLGVDVEIEHDEKRLHAVDRPGLAWLADFGRDVTEYTFAEAVDAFTAQAGAIDPVREELGRLGLLEEAVTAPALRRFEFYLQAYEVPVDRRNEGVLLADAKAAATVDRPTVFYLGMDESWTHDAPRRPWVDSDAAFTRNLRQFTRLLQNGRNQYFFVLDERGGRAVTPCLYLEDLFDRDYERFADLDTASQQRTYQASGDGFDHTPLDVETETLETISQSGLNALVNCPRDHLFSRLVDGPDRDYFVTGTLFHDFAEVYATHPDQIDRAAVDDVVELMVEAIAPFDRDVDEPTRRTEFRVGLQTLMTFLDDDPPEGAPFLPATRESWGNEVADHLGLSVDAPHTEWWFEDVDLGIKGLIDLVHTDTALLDYKSGRRVSAAQVVEKSAVDPIHDVPDFQALMYLTYLRSAVPDQPLEFTFFHFLEILDDVVSGDADLEDCLTRVTYHPVPFETYVTRPAVLERFLEDGPRDCRKTFEEVDVDIVVELIDGHDFPAGSTKAEVTDSALGAALLRQLRDLVGDYQYVENGCAQALSSLASYRDEAYFADDLDAFETFVDERLAALNRYRDGTERFPVEGLGGEPNYRRVDTRDMLFEGDV